MASHDQKLPRCDHDLNLQGTPASANVCLAGGEKDSYLYGVVIKYRENPSCSPEAL